MTARMVADLKSRAVLAVTGADATAFLDRLVTADMEAIAPGSAGYGALLTPQGKILTDFLLVPVDDGFLLDCPVAAAADLLKRLTLYRLRAKVGIADVTSTLAVLALWGDGEPPAMPGRTVRDPRHPALGYRAYVAEIAVGPAEGFAGSVIAPEAAYHEHRTTLGIPEAGSDFALGEAFPHEIAMDQLAGVAFDKGCYVGQEVVSRMEHRGSARRRPVLVAADEALPPTGTAILVGDRIAGTLGSAYGSRGMAIVRLDKIADAVADAVLVTSGGVALRVGLPDWAHYAWPTSAANPAPPDGSD